MNASRALLRLLTLCVAAAGAGATTPAAGAQDADVADANGPRVSGTLTFTCTPDERSAKAGALPFEDTLEIGNDRVRSEALSKDGFPVALSIPKTVDGVPTFNARFKRGPDTATYFVRAKPGGAVTGSLTRSEGGKTLRYTIGRRAAAGAATRPSAKGAHGGDEKDGADPAFDARVLRVNGAFVRLMSVQAATADAGVNADKAKLAAILKLTGAEHNDLKAEMLKGSLTPAQYVERAEQRLAVAQKALAQLLGDKAAAVDAAYAKPFAGTYVYLNRMRAAAAQVGAGQVDKRPDKAVYDALMELTALARDPGKLTAEAAAKIRERAHAAVLAALGADARPPFEAALAGLASGDGGAVTTTPSTRKSPPTRPQQSPR